MPLEIKELVIKAEITEESGNQSNSSSTGGRQNAVDVESIVAACVDQVMELMRTNSDR